MTSEETAVPTYSYACTQCDNRFDIVQSFTDEALTTCTECSGKLRKLFNSVGVVFKGSGFYRTDSRSEQKSSTATKSATDKSGGETKNTAEQSGTSANGGSEKSSTTSQKSSNGSSASAPKASAAAAS